MARIADRVRSLADDDEEMESAVETVLERADEGRVEWADVNDELTSGQWGRLIEHGVVEGDDEGMHVADVDDVKVGLYGEPESGDGDGDSVLGDMDDEEPPGDSSWSKWDKIAGLAALSLFPGYYFNSIRDTIGGVVDVVLGPLEAVLPFYGVILVLAVLTGLYSTLLMDNLMDADRMAYYQGRMQRIQERREAAKERGDEEELERIQEEQMEAIGENLGMFKEQIRPMVWTMLLIIPVFLWMYWRIFAGETGSVVMPMVGQVQWTDGVVGPLQAWILWYFVCSMGFSQILRKALNVQTSPTGGSTSTESSSGSPAST